MFHQHVFILATCCIFFTLKGSLRRAYHSQNPTSSRKVQVTLPLSFCHMSKSPKVIESDISWHALVVVYLFRVLEIQMTRCNGQWKVDGTVAEISNARAKLISTHTLCMVVLDRYYNSTVRNGSSCSRVLWSQPV